ncbi:Olfactory Receptor 14I1 [Manis pentadactyla]|nr:Olfactory Receptor 14I1 [Manis pentadactyla]
MQTLNGVLFLMTYLAALLGNGLIIMLITWDHQLHTPMYFYLKNLSFIDICYISDTVPKFALNSLANRNKIYFLGCVFQVLLFVTFGALAYLKPASQLKSIVDLVLSVFYTVIPPSVNPIIYSLRNKDIKEPLILPTVVLTGMRLWCGGIWDHAMDIHLPRTQTFVGFQQKCLPTFTKTHVQ